MADPYSFRSVGLSGADNRQGGMQGEFQQLQEASSDHSSEQIRFWESSSLCLPARGKQEQVLISPAHLACSGETPALLQVESGWMPMGQALGEPQLPQSMCQPDLSPGLHKPTVAQHGSGTGLLANDPDQMQQGQLRPLHLASTTDSMTRELASANQVRCADEVSVTSIRNSLKSSSLS